MKLFRALTVVCFGITLLTACKKSENNDNTNTTTTKTKKQMLLDGKWQITAGIVTATYMGKDTTIDIYKEMETCDKDDFMLFTDDGKATIDESTNKCTKDSQIETATWALLNNDTKIAVVDSNPDTFDLDISATEMKWKLSTKNTAGTPLNYVYTYKNIK
jgi:hypothetical protein